MAVLDVNTDALVSFTNTLEKLSENDVPRVVAKTLNSAALDVKQKTMPASARRTFTNRSKNFFKSHSQVEFAKRSSNINNIKSTVGFTDKKIPTSQNKFAVKELEQQEYGGSIKKRSFIPLNRSRVGGSYNRNVAKRNRLGNIKFVKARQAQGVNEGQRFIKSVMHAGRGGHVLSEKGILFRVNSVRRTKGGALKLTALYSFKKSRTVRVHNTNFMRYASERSSEKLDDLFIKEAKKQIEFRTIS
jgi:hypothetical protein